MENIEKKNGSQLEANIELKSMNKNSSEETSNNAQNGTTADNSVQKDMNVTSSNSGSEKTGNAGNGTNTARRLLEESASKGSEAGGSGTNANSHEDVPVTTVENDAGLEADADSSFELLREGDELADEYTYDYDDYVDETMWGEEEWTEAQHEAAENYVNVDSHILCTPVGLIGFRISSLLHAQI